MNRRQAIKAACASSIAPWPAPLEVSPGVYKVAYGDRGTVSIDSRMVKAISCCPVEGWAECYTDENGRPLGLSEPVMMLEGEAITARVHGNVRCEPMEQEA